MPNFFLSSYAPLVATKAGRAAAIKYELPPFIDGSIRREPDLEHEYPAVTSLCRKGKLAPRLRKGDVVAYMLKRACYGMGYKHQRITAVLRVIAIKQSHAEGAAWYRQDRRRLPNNCVVLRNKAFPLAKSHQRIPNRTIGCEPDEWCRWDAHYKLRADADGTFAICQRLFINLDWDAPEVTKEALLAAFGKVPCTRNPKKQSLKAGQRLLKRLGLTLKL